jgi:hypothetical protein
MVDGADILAHHPSTAHFIATKLVRHFVSDNPPPALVDRVAQVFRKQRRYFARHWRHSLFAGIQFCRGLSRQDQATFELASARCARWALTQWSTGIASVDRAHGRAALRLPNTEWVF